MDAPLHPDVAALGFLLGTWEGEGAGEYPTIDAFTYHEHVEFGHTGKPFLTYLQRTRSLDDGRPLHAEVGFVRPAGAAGVELVLAHPFGICEVEEGTVAGSSLRLRATGLIATATAKAVEAIERDIDVADDTLTYAVRMAAVGQALTHHLSARLHRVR